MKSALQKELFSALIDAFRELDTAEILLNAKREHLAGAVTKLNEMEAFVASHGSSPRYGASYESNLRDARRVEHAANDRVSDAAKTLLEKRDLVVAAYEKLMRSTKSCKLDSIPALCADCFRLEKTISDIRHADVCRCDRIKTLSENRQITNR